MKKMFNMFMFCLIFIAVTTVNFASAESKELVKNPTMQQLEGKWEGQWKDDTFGKRMKSASAIKSGTASATFSGTEVNHTYKNNFTGKVSISSNGEIAIVNPANPRREESCKLFKRGAAYILECEYTYPAIGLETVNGKATLEKK